MVDLVKLIIFLGFLGLGSLTALCSDAPRRRTLVNGLLAYLVVVSLVVGLSQHNAWPFTNYPIIFGSDPEGREVVLFGVDGEGREWPIDPDTWAPVSPVALTSWLRRRYAALPEPQQRRVASFLLARAEVARQRIASGHRIGADRYLGPLTAPPDWGVYRHPSPPSASYVGLRVLELTWVPVERLSNPARVRRSIVAEYDGR